MFSMPDVAVILGVVLLIFGPKKLPEIGASLGKGIKSFRKATEEGEKIVNEPLTALDPQHSIPQLTAETVEKPEGKAEAGGKSESTVK